MSEETDIESVKRALRELDTLGACPGGHPLTNENRAWDHIERRLSRLEAVIQEQIDDFEQRINPAMEAAGLHPATRSVRALRAALAAHPSEETPG